MGSCVGCLWYDTEGADPLCRRLDKAEGGDTIKFGEVDGRGCDQVEKVLTCSVCGEKLIMTGARVYYPGNTHADHGGVFT